MPMAGSLNELFFERLKNIIPTAQWDSVRSSFSVDKPVTLRVNTLKADVAAPRRLPLKRKCRRNPCKAVHTPRPRADDSWIAPCLPTER